jgi:hypothetical protein
VGSEEIQVLIFFYLGDFLPKPLTFSETSVRGLLIMRRLYQGGIDAERSLLLVASLERVLLLFLV